MDKDYNIYESKVEALVEAHWEYIKQLLIIHNINTEENLDVIGFHYKTAFIHGWKHALEEVRNVR